ncbi:MAG TPA: CBS domain-containing protein, partial [Chloroflexota bacterium]|nr:CBS domain-containing protein [Chloroflexota bacterium]
MKARYSGNDAATQQEFTKVQELIYELRVDQVMTSPVITLVPQQSMNEAKEMMRFHRISGLPVASNGSIDGILSIEDVIRWLESGGQEAPASDWMTRKVLTVCGDEAAVQAIAKFGRHKVGRLPVVDRAGALIGIVTSGDIIGRALRVLDARYREEEARRGAARCTLDELVGDGTSFALRYEVAPRDFQHAGYAATKVTRILDGLGMDRKIVRRAGIAAYEAEMNLSMHTERGGSLRADIGPGTIVIEALDDGPGIADIEQALTAGYSSAPDWIRELGFGAG